MSSSVSGATTIHAPGNYADIQDAIDHAADADVILVEKGVYFGTLNFDGKDVAVRSVAGPGTTVLESTGEVGVQMGPGGEISGFTLTRTFGLGAAIVTTGDGSLIEGNVIHGFSRSFSSSVVGVEGGTPIVRGNVFRNNSCGLSSDAVVRVGGPHPSLIVNNVFEGNNGCAAIEVADAFVSNNTIVANRTGIKVDVTDLPLLAGYRSNIIFGNETGVSIARGDDAVSALWEANLVFGNETDYSDIENQTGSRANLSADPKFADSLY